MGLLSLALPLPLRATAAILSRSSLYGLISTARSGLPGCRTPPRTESRIRDRGGKAQHFAHITDGDPREWQNSIEIVLRRFAEFRDLEGAFKRRAITERAKGILMERYAVDEEGAFRMLRDHARRTRTVLVETAQSIIDGRLLTGEP